MIYEPRILYLVGLVITVRGADVSIVRVAREKRDRWSTNAYTYQNNAPCK